MIRMPGMQQLFARAQLVFLLWNALMHTNGVAVATTPGERDALQALQASTGAVWGQGIDEDGCGAPGVSCCELLPPSLAGGAQSVHAYALRQVHLDGQQAAEPSAPVTMLRPCAPSASGSVMALTLRGAGLAGRLPEGVLGSLPFLEVLDLSDNPGLTGSLPNDVLQLPGLVLLDARNTSMVCGGSMAAQPPQADGCRLPGGFAPSEARVVTSAGIGPAGSTASCEHHLYRGSGGTAGGNDPWLASSAAPLAGLPPGAGVLLLDPAYFQFQQCRCEGGAGAGQAPQVVDAGRPTAVALCLAPTAPASSREVQYSDDDDVPAAFIGVAAGFGALAVLLLIAVLVALLMLLRRQRRNRRRESAAAGLLTGRDDSRGGFRVGFLPGTNTLTRGGAGQVSGGARAMAQSFTTTARRIISTMSLAATAATGGWRGSPSGPGMSGLNLKRQSTAASVAPADAIKRQHPPGTLPALFGHEVTLVATDVEGSTELWEWDPAVMNYALALHDKAMRLSLAACYGYEVMTEGDAFLVAFHEPVDAARWCLLLQSTLLKLDWPAPLLEHPRCRPRPLTPVEHEASSCASLEARHTASAMVAGWGGARTTPASDHHVLPRSRSRELLVLFKGLAVRMGMATGTPSAIREHPVTKRLQYVGTLLRLATSIADIGAGGMVLLEPVTFKGVHNKFEELDVTEEEVQQLADLVNQDSDLLQPKHSFEPLPDMHHLQQLAEEPHQPPPADRLSRNSRQGPQRAREQAQQLPPVTGSSASSVPGMGASTYAARLPIGASTAGSSSMRGGGGGSTLSALYNKTLSSITSGSYVGVHQLSPRQPQLMTLPSAGSSLGPLPRDIPPARQQVHGGADLGLAGDGAGSGATRAEEGPQPTAFAPGSGPGSAPGVDVLRQTPSSQVPGPGPVAEGLAGGADDADGGAEPQAHARPRAAGAGRGAPTLAVQLSTAPAAAGLQARSAAIVGGRPSEPGGASLTPVVAAGGELPETASDSSASPAVERHTCPPASNPFSHRTRPGLPPPSLQATGTVPLPMPPAAASTHLPASATVPANFAPAGAPGSMLYAAGGRLGIMAHRASSTGRIVGLQTREAAQAALRGAPGVHQGPQQQQVLSLGSTMGGVLEFMEANAAAREALMLAEEDANIGKGRNAATSGAPARPGNGSGRPLLPPKDPRGSVAGAGGHGAGAGVGDPPPLPSMASTTSRLEDMGPAAHSSAHHPHHQPLGQGQSHAAATPFASRGARKPIDMRALREHAIKSGYMSPSTKALLLPPKLHAQQPPKQQPIPQQQQAPPPPLPPLALPQQQPVQPAPASVAASRWPPPATIDGAAPMAASAGQPGTAPDPDNADKPAPPVVTAVVSSAAAAAGAAAEQPPAADKDTPLLSAATSIEPSRQVSPFQSASHELSRPGSQPLTKRPSPFRPRKAQQSQPGTASNGNSTPVSTAGGTTGVASAGAAYSAAAAAAAAGAPDAPRAGSGQQALSGGPGSGAAAPPVPPALSQDQRQDQRAPAASAAGAPPSNGGDPEPQQPERESQQAPEGLQPAATAATAVSVNITSVPSGAVHRVVVVDMGVHRLKLLSADIHDLYHGVQVMSILPANLKARAAYQQRLGSLEQLAPSFFDAPGAAQALLPLPAGRLPSFPPVSLVFITPDGFASVAAASQVVADKSEAVFCDTVRHVIKMYGIYECQEYGGSFMVAAVGARAASEAALALQEWLLAADWPADLLEMEPGRVVLDEAMGKVLRRGLRAKVGVYTGAPLSVVPHTTSGRADYFGAIVNRAARLMAGARPGEILLDKVAGMEVLAAWQARDTAGTDAQGMQRGSRPVSKLGSTASHRLQGPDEPHTGDPQGPTALPGSEQHDGEPHLAQPPASGMVEPAVLPRTPSHKQHLPGTQALPPRADGATDPMSQDTRQAATAAHAAADGRATASRASAPGPARPALLVTSPPLPQVQSQPHPSSDDAHGAVGRPRSPTSAPRLQPYPQQHAHAAVQQQPSVPASSVAVAPDEQVVAEQAPVGSLERVLVFDLGECQLKGLATTQSVVSLRLQRQYYGLPEDAKGPAAGGGGGKVSLVKAGAGLLAEVMVRLPLPQLHYVDA